MNEKPAKYIFIVYAYGIFNINYANNYFTIHIF